MSDNNITPEFLAAVSEHTGVPLRFLTGDTIAAVWDSARLAAQWKADTGPPATAAVSATFPPGPISPRQIVNGTGDWMGAYRSGRLGPAGIPAPPKRDPRDRRGMPW